MALDILQPYAALIFFLAALPFCLWAAYSDLSVMKIPNRLCLWMFVAFCVCAILILPWGAFGVRLIAAAVALVIGFLLNMGGLVGGGDAKFVTAMIPFVAPGDYGPFLLMACVTTLAAVFTHRMFVRTLTTGHVAENWKSWSEKKYFPMGLALAGSLIFYQLWVLLT
ncbi:A24 family peptidase [Oceanomicrobium pacificus]|uniref:Prepilin type IV endopeptidase peptidase domain-containing protein n=1 Tax=Oceanomicrobium pacificus TaxID=2692916 RepID=A0A6B0TRJ7_9RHOB|nr:prepilin peptidase [Oceanomicrobium pacificus]MXU65329.1 hypothetical protein [Oceanomicrobium pacificus]